MKGSAFLFATDLHDEGIEAVLDNLQGRAGLEGVSLACAYHHARDVFPHNPVRKVRYLEGGTVFFRPDPARYRGLRIQPQVSQLAQQVDMLALLVEAAQRRRMTVRAWTVFLHNTRLGSHHPECAMQNAFGDPYITQLCPANPEVRAFAAALAADIARYGVDAVLAEALGYLGFDHGYHHERCFVPLSPIARFLFGLCFCPNCLELAARAGVDGEQVRAAVRSILEEALTGVPPAELARDLTWENVAGFAGGELGRYLQARTEAVTELAAAVRRAVHEGHPQAVVYFLDMSGAAKGYATGEPTGEPAPAAAWQDGVDVVAAARAAGGLEAIGYARDPERLRLDLAAYRELLPPGIPFSVALRPMAPDCESPENLTAKVAVAREAGAGWVDFYHYGFMPLDRLDWIRQALHG
jgi:hypothetical protein